MMVCLSFFSKCILFVSYYTVAVVGLEETDYNVSESDGTVELCAVVFMPTDDCPVAFEFEVMLSADNLTAGTVFCNSVTSFTISLSLYRVSYGLCGFPYNFDLCSVSDEKLCKCFYCG